MKKILIIISFVLLFICGGLHAQDIETIVKSPEYICGKGVGYTLAEADNAALDDLVRQINVTVKGGFTSKEREVVEDGAVVTSESDYNKIVESYSTATLNNAQRYIVKDEPDAEVVRYIRKSEIERAFKARLDKAVSFVEYADVALKKQQIDDALRYYYWSFNLVKSLRYPNEAVAEIDGCERMLVTWLPQRIDEVLTDLKFSAVKRRNGKNEYDLYVTYKDKPVKSLDYIFFDGQDYSAIYSIADGQGMVDPRSAFSAENLNVKVEYEFKNMAVSDDEVKSVLEAQKKSFFKNANISVRLSSPSKANDFELSRVEVKVDNTLMMAEAESDDYVDKVLKVSNEIKALRISGLRPMFSADGWDDFSKIMSYGSVMINDDQNLECFEENGDVVCRGLACNFKFGKSKVFNETLSFNFDDEGRISHVALGLGKMAMNDILTKARWGNESRKKLISFLEDYRTAYAVKDAEYMEAVFADDALIIVGRTLKKDYQSTDRTYTDNKYVQLTRLTKRQFIDRLINSFRSKEYINLHFSDLKVVKLRPDQERYGIQVRQDYYSSNYGDVGYLYLLVDLTDIEKPIIHVRTWQDTPDPEFGIIGPGFF